MGSVEEVVEAFEELLAQGRHGKSFNEFARSGRGELFILKYLSRKTAPVLPSELGAALGSSTSRISAALKTLEKKGLISREIDVSDRRSILVTITDAGREQISAMVRHMRDYLTAVVIEMGLEDAREFLRLARRFFAITHGMMPDMRHFRDAPPCGGRPGEWPPCRHPPGGGQTGRQPPGNRQPREWQPGNGQPGEWPPRDWSPGNGRHGNREPGE